MQILFLTSPLSANGGCFPLHISPPFRQCLTSLPERGRQLDAGAHAQEPTGGNDVACECAIVKLPYWILSALNIHASGW